MSLRTLIRLAVLALAAFLFSPLLWPTAGPWTSLAGPGLLVATLGYLLLASGARPTSRWQLRYQMDTRQANERLDATLNFLADHAGQITLEANEQGLFFEAPVAFDRYVQIQMEQALPEARVTRARDTTGVASGDPIPQGYLCLGSPDSELLRWATAGKERTLRLFLQRGPYATLLARSTDSPPPGRWLRLPGRQPIRLWARLPLWDELSAGVQPGHLLPTTENGAVYSCRSRLLNLELPAAYQNDGDRRLGTALDGRDLSLPYTTPLFTVDAPAAFLVRQAVEDLQRGQTVVVLSPHRRTLATIQRQAQAMTYWLDPNNARPSAHLAIVAAGEWHQRNVETTLRLTEEFLATLGLSLRLPAVRTLVRHLIRILAASAQATTNDFAFTDLYAISQSVQTLRAFLDDLRDLGDRLDAETRDSIRHLDGQLAHKAGYLQVVTVLSTLRAVLSPLRSGALHTLCRPPFLNTSQALHTPGLLLVPMTNADFPEYDRFLAAMLDLALQQQLAARPDNRLALHLHDPQGYYQDNGQHHVEAAQQTGSFSLLVNARDPDAYLQILLAEGEGNEGELIFRSSEALASTLIADWNLPYSLGEVAELPAHTALARLPGLPGPVMMHAGDENPRNPQP
jgi:hypothetical protein